jgi:branched-chain amino acid transport system ATP-binding protein
LAPSETLLALEGIEAGYGKKQVLNGVSLEVGVGEAVALLGHNGAGKTTLLRAAFGLEPLWGGGIAYAGRGLPHRYSARDAVRMGMAMIPAERFVFPDLTVGDNLLLSARSLARADREARIAEAFAAFPVLEERRRQLAGTMSGGEQRMISLSMALMSRPRLLLLDEPSLGLAPVIAESIMERVRGLVADGTSVILVEQNVSAALSVASRVYVIRGGEGIVGESTAEFEARGREAWWKLF